MMFIAKDILHSFIKYKDKIGTYFEVGMKYNFNQYFRD